MSRKRFFWLISAAALSTALVIPAGAVTITLGGTAIAGEGVESSIAGAKTITFDGLSTLPVGFSAIGTNPANPLVTGTCSAACTPLTGYHAPTGDTSTYLSTGAGTITEQLGSSVSYFGFYWGSLDTYNTFSLTESNAATFNFSGTALASSLNLSSAGDTSYFFNFFADPGTKFTSAAFASSPYAFEFDNIATDAPEPSSLAMIAGLMLILAGTLRRRKA